MKFFMKESRTVQFQTLLAFAPHLEKWYIATTVNRSPVTILYWDVLVLVIALSAQVCLVSRVHNHAYPMYTHHTYEQLFVGKIILTISQKSDLTNSSLF